MAATYDDTLPTEKDKVRSDLGGIVTILPSANPLLTDEHIDAVLELEGSRSSAVAYLARELVMRFAGRPRTIKVGDVSLDYTKRIDHWEELAGRIEISSGTSVEGLSQGSVAVTTEVVW